MANRSWYAMRSRLRAAGKWKEGDKATHKVAAQEEGEPDPKKPKDGDDGDTDPEMPPLESPETSEGNYLFLLGTRCLLLDSKGVPFWLGLIWILLSFNEIQKMEASVMNITMEL